MRSEKKNSILYVGSFRLPDRNAGAIRVCGVADALRDAGYEITFVGDEEFAMQVGTATGKRLYTLQRGFHHLVTSRSYLTRLAQVDWNRVAAVIFYPGSGSLIWQLLKICERERIPLIVDSGEWYNPSHTPGGRFGPFALDSEVRMRWLHLKAGNMICDSSFLVRYYTAKGCNAILVHTPIGKDSDELFDRLRRDPQSVAGQVILVYAGSPGRKELFSEVAEASQISRTRGIDVVFRVVGVNETQFSAIVKEQSGQLPNMDGIQCYGRLPRPAALEIVASSDFTVIVRPNERFAHAGFPSKLVESLGLGVPVIANATSDIAEYVRDGQEGYLLDSPTAKALERAIGRAAKLSMEQKAEMRERARLRAFESFGYRQHVDRLVEFISSAELCR